MHLDLIALTIDLFFEQNLDRPSNCLRASRIDVEVRIKSLAHSKCNRISSCDKTTPVFSSRSLISHMYFLKIIGLALPPWLTPTTNIGYAGCFHSAMCTGFNEVMERTCLFIRSNALKTLIKHMMRFCPSDSCRSIKLCKMKIMSVYWLSFRKPPKYLFLCKKQSSKNSSRISTIILKILRDAFPCHAFVRR